MKNPERMLGVFNKRNKARLLPYARIISQVEGYDLSLSAPLAEGYDLSLSAPLAHSSYHRPPLLSSGKSAVFRLNFSGDPADIPSPPAGGARGKVH